MRRTRLLPLSSAALLLATLLAAAPAAAQVVGTLTVDENRLAGTHVESGALLLYAPDPVQPGSSIGHWDTSATPNLLMEPNLAGDLPFLGLDITPGLMADIGWPLTSDPGGGPPVQFDVFDLDAPGTGFTDPRPFAGAPGNPATTLGEARVNLFNAVLGAWGTELSSIVPVDVLVTWQPLPCDPSFGAVLGGATTIFVFQGDDLPVADVWYPAALAEALFGADLSGPPENDGGDIFVVLSSALDDGCLGEGTSWYYGLDANPPANALGAAPVVLHELGHGLGFASFVDEETGEELVGFPGIYDTFVYDEEVDQAWTDMTDRQRLFSARNFRDVTWTGAEANVQAGQILDHGVPLLRITSPAAVAGAYEIGGASFGAPFPAAGLTAEIACLIDPPDFAANGSTLDGCGPATNPDELAGKIALIDRGTCSFVDKARNAQAAGAVGAIVVNNQGNAPPGLGGAGADVTIPVVSLGAADGNRIRQAACPAAAGLLLDDRFQVTVYWNRTPIGKPATMDTGKAVPISDSSAYFYFRRPETPEVFVRMTDACEAPGYNSFWVFAGGLTNVEVKITVTDTQTGLSRRYDNPPATPFVTVLDTDAFATCL